ncbi:Xylose isomerase-like TIM barrel [Planctomycetes bacterium Pla163]|uniref:Xylose isomerase-like TIM barrel n=1 Tax=Rohdeia mirabilis TaxID=2528008 RepID=A0A518CUP1_9BACT|nr:Xylose isomerase-like TIM barrel [Planctomycetes bacterium Pla163]
MLLGYNTNGLAHHRLDDALALLADLGYGGVALTLDVGHIDPLRATAAEVQAVARRCDALGLARAVETGARFVLDPRNKHFPTLMEASAVDRAKRVDFLVRCAAIATDLGAEVVSIWAGAAPAGVVGDGVGGDGVGGIGAGGGGAKGGADDGLWQRLVDGVEALLARTAQLPVRICFEPEPGMFVERPAGYLELVRRLGERGVGADRLPLTLDVGHLLCTGDLPVPERIVELAPHLRHVHLDDIANGVHEHRPFGEGDLDLAGTLAALERVGFGGMAAVELSRDSHRGAAMAEEALRRIDAARA